MVEQGRRGGQRGGSGGESQECTSFDDGKTLLNIMRVLKCVAVTWRCVAACCSVMQYVAACYSVMQCDAV